MDVRSFKNATERREGLEKELKLKLKNISSYAFDESIVSSKNCENLIGSVHIPLGIAGPLRIVSDYSSSEAKRSREVQDENSSRQARTIDFYIPLATTEGALVASVSRGCKAITVSKGANVYAYRVGTTRGPVFYTSSLKKSRELYEWMKDHQEKLKKIAQATSSHLVFKKAKVSSVGDYVFVRFSFDTQDAMGMNMVTIATEKITEVIAKETGVACLAVAGNFDVDKKASFLNFIENRGFKAWADIVLSKEVVTDVLKTTPQKIFDVWLAKCMLGSAMSGSLGFNAQFANIVAAMFLATGQDPAHVVEGSMGVTTTKVLENGDLYCSIYLPSLMLGTVGGGTELATQKEALSLLGVAGGNSGKNSQKFAEIVAGAVLAGEISLLASLAEGSLGKAHEKLGRGKI